MVSAPCALIPWLPCPRCAGRDLRVAGVLEKWRQPAELELRSSFNERVGAIQGNDMRWLRIHEVRIFCGLRERDYVHAIAADFARECREVRSGSYHAELRDCW